MTEPTTVRVIKGLQAMAQAAVDANPNVPPYDLSPDTIDQGTAALLIQQGMQARSLAELGAAYPWPSVAMFSWWVSTAIHFFDTFHLSPPQGSVNNAGFLLAIVPSEGAE